jgi:taurine--2-oxoglutarate transaminase
MAIAGGSGSTVWDHDGNTYLDFSSQLVNTNIGHQHPKVIAAIARQATLGDRGARCTPTMSGPRPPQKILSHAPANMDKVFFTNGGADANENAIRMARLHTGRDKVISRYRSYHGNTGAAIAATGDWRRIPNEYSRGHVHVFGPYLYRSEFWAETPEQEPTRAAPPAPRHPGRRTAIRRRHPARNGPRHRRDPDCRRPATWKASARSAMNTAS